MLLRSGTQREGGLYHVPIARHFSGGEAEPSWFAQELWWGVRRGRRREGLREEGEGFFWFTWELLE